MSVVNPYMTIPEYIRRGDLIQDMPGNEVVDLCNKIYKYHALPMSHVRHELGFPVFVSQRSGWRPIEHEKERDRSGVTEHLFTPLKRPGSENGLGAADYITRIRHMIRFCTILVEMDIYPRLCFYPEALTPFVHGDHRFPERPQRLFLSTSDGWEHVDKAKFISVVQTTIKSKKKELYELGD